MNATAIDSDYWVSFKQIFDEIGWPFANISPDALGNVYAGAPQADQTTGATLIPLRLDSELVFKVPGLDFLSVAIAPGSTGSTEILLTASAGPPAASLTATAELRIDASILQPLKAGTDDPDPDQPEVRISLGTVTIGYANGDLQLDLSGAVNLPRCMIGTSGVVIAISNLKWVTPSTASSPRPGFTGLYMQSVDAHIAGLANSTGVIQMTDVFISTGGFSGTIDWSDPALAWNDSTQTFSGVLTGQLFGFEGALNSVAITFEQTVLTACEIAGQIFVPYLDRRLGLDIGFDGKGDITAAVSVPQQPSDPGATAGPTGYLVEVSVAGFMTLDIQSAQFDRPASGNPVIEITGKVALTVSGLDGGAFDFKGLRIDNQGHVAVDGGWIDISTSRSVALSGFPLEVSKVGFGTDDTGDRRWVGLNGGLKLADGLPLGVSVEGLRISWSPTGSAAIGVSLGGVALKVSIPGTLQFDGKVAYFSSGGISGFSGHVTLSLTALQLTVDAHLKIAHDQAGNVFFYLYLACDLPAGIPLFGTGAAIYGFAGLVATNLAPDRHAGEDWYYGWYLRNPPGATDESKWAPQLHAFAGGLGTTIGTAADNGFTFSAKVLLILVLPGPQLILQGKARFLAKRPDAKDPTSQGSLEALLVLDFAGQLFQANVTAAYNVPNLLKIQGGADVAYSWAPTPPPDVWHFYLGQKAPPERRLQADLLQVLRANAYFMVTKLAEGSSTELTAHRHLLMGGWVGINKKFDYGPAHAWLQASLEGEALVSVNPQQVDATFDLKGTAGISAFGVNVQVTLDAAVHGKGPNPWYLLIPVHLEIKIDLWLWHWSTSVDLPLTFGDPDQPLPQPASPIVLRLAAEHMKATESVDLDQAIVPPDTRPVVLFNRPVQDAAAIGNPSVPNPNPETVGPRTFGYGIDHIVLQRSGGDLVTAAGGLQISNGTISLAGSPPLGAAAGSALILLGPQGGTFTITGVPPGGLAISGAPPADGSYAYRILGAQATATVNVTQVTQQTPTIYDLTLAADPGQPADAFAGGQLSSQAGQWTILGSSGASITVQVPVTPPAGGPATIQGPPPPTMAGKWLPDDNGGQATTNLAKLMIWATTPFAYFRNSSTTVTQGFEQHNPDYACGPAPDQVPICLHFEDLPVGALTGSFVTDLVPGTASGDVQCVTPPGGTGTDRQLRIGVRPDGSNGTASLALSWAPAIDGVWVYCSAQEGGTVQALSGGQVVQSAPVPPMAQVPVIFTGPLDQIEISGTQVTLSQICFVPGWACIHFDAASFPQGTTGRQFYAGLQLDSPGIMNVSPQGVLSANPIPALPMRSPHSSDGFRRLLPGLSPADPEHIVSTVPWHAPGPGPVEMSLPGFSRPEQIEMAGLGPVHVRPLTPLSGPPGDRVLMPERQTPAPSLTARPTAPSPAPANLSPAGMSLALLFPQPVTRARVKLASAATVVACAGTAQVAQSTGSPGDDVELVAYSGWIDRLIVINPDAVSISGCCYDAGPFGWQRFEQWSWQQSVQASVESMYEADPVLPPGGYTLTVVTSVAIGGPQPATNYETGTATFQVGPPPGLGQPTGDPSQDRFYPHGGPLDELSTYVDSTVPAAGDRAFYRSYDVGVLFNEPYVSRVYMEAGAALTVAVVDANQQDLRAGAPNYWGNRPDLELSDQEIEWIKTLNGDGTHQCASVSLDKVVHDEGVLAGAGELLKPAQLHAGELRAHGASGQVHRFEFVTSQYTSFLQHMAGFTGRCPAATATTVTTPDPSPLLTALLEARILLDRQITNYEARQQGATTGTPTAQQLDAFTQVKGTVAAARQSLQQLWGTTFGQIWAGYFTDPPPSSLPESLEITLINPASGSPGPSAFLLGSPEPMHWERVYLDSDAATTAPPLRQRSISFDASFGAPDAGTTFQYGSLTWTTSAELQLLQGVVQARVPGPLTLTIGTPAALIVTVQLAVSDGGTVQLTGTGQGVITPPQQGPTTAPVNLTVTGDYLTEVSISGTGFSLSAVTVVEQFQPVTPTGKLRVLQAQLPSGPGDTSHYVDLIPFGDVDLAGWSLTWFDALNPAAAGAYHTFTTGDSLPEGTLARVYGGLATAPPDPGYQVYCSGLSGAIPASGAVFRLADPSGTMAHEMAVMPDSAFTSATNLATVPSDDGTRAFLLPDVGAVGSLPTGHWRLAFRFQGDAGPEIAKLSIGGKTSDEIAVIRFTTS